MEKEDSVISMICLYEKVGKDCETGRNEISRECDSTAYFGGVIDENKGGTL